MIFKTTLAAGAIGLAALAAAPANAASLTVGFGDDGARIAYHDGRPVPANYYGHGYDWPDYGWGDRHDEWRHTLSAKEVRRILHGRGYHDIDYVDSRGSIYQVRATDHRGHRVGLVVSARNATILKAYRIR